MEKHKTWVCVFCEHRDVAVVAATGNIPSVRYRVQHAERYAGRTGISGSQESSRKAVKIRNNMIY